MGPTQRQRSSHKRHESWLSSDACAPSTWSTLGVADRVEEKGTKTSNRSTASDSEIITSYGYSPSRTGIVPSPTRSHEPQRANLKENEPYVLQPVHPRPLATAEVLCSHSNFSARSRVDILRVSNKSRGWRYNGDDHDLDRAIKEMNDCVEDQQPALLLIIVYLTFDENATYTRRASSSRYLVERVMQEYHIDEEFLHDLLGRPDYWSPVSRDVHGPLVTGLNYEFGCQHARWLMKNRWDNNGGPRSPCSVYLRYCQRLNLTVYIISGDEEDSCIAAVRQQLGYSEGLMPKRSTQRRQNFASESPFLVHTLVLGASFEQSKEYIGEVRRKLMAEIERVNNYQYNGLVSNKNRSDLQIITQNLHGVSQTVDSGMANVEMSIKLTKAMAQAFSKHKSARQPASGIVQQTGETIDYLLSSWESQKNWLINYKARKDTAMNFVFNTVTQLDSAVNIDMGRKMSQDSSSMNAITILTMVFLPATFISGVFSSGIFSSAEEKSYRMSALFWPYLYTVVPFTVIVFMIYLGRAKISFVAHKLRIRTHRFKQQVFETGRLMFLRRSEDGEDLESQREK